MSRAKRLGLGVPYPPLARRVPGNDVLKMRHPGGKREFQPRGERIEAPCPGVNQARYEVRKDARLERFKRLAVQIGLVATPCRFAPTVVYVGAEAHEFGPRHLRGADRRKQAGKNPVPCLGVAHCVPRVRDLWGAKFRMLATVSIELGAVGKINASIGIKAGQAAKLLAGELHEPVQNQTAVKRTRWRQAAMAYSVSRPKRRSAIFTP